MLIPNHPDDERLSALASRDTDATADARLTAHVSSCIRCTELVSELGALRIALADLPDLRPSRPLQLVPPEEADHAVDRLGSWARRFFAPVLVSGAALVLVGVIGTANPSFTGQAETGAEPSATGFREAAGAGSLASPEDDGDTALNSDASDAPAAVASGVPAPGTADGGDGGSRESLLAEPSPETQTLGSEDGLPAAGYDDRSARALLDSSRSPWPMVLFAGVALIIAALLMRWILVPRAR